MQDWQKRVFDEKSELDEKIKNLTIWLGASKGFPENPAEYERLARQHKHMSAYSDVLAERIAAFSL